MSTTNGVAKRQPPSTAFRVGNRGGPGNPHVHKVAEFRAALLECVTREDLVAVFRTLVDLAKAGDLGAIKELFDRTVGKATLPVEVRATVGGVEALSDAELEAIILASQAVDGGELVESDSPALLGSGPASKPEPRG